MASYECENCGYFGVLSDEEQDSHIECSACGSSCRPLFVAALVDIAPPASQHDLFSSPWTFVTSGIGIFFVLMLICCGVFGSAKGSSRPTKVEVKNKVVKYESESGEILSWVDEALLRSVFGKPDRISSSGDKITWTYRCSDGNVYVRYTEAFSGNGFFTGLDEN